MSSIEIAHPEVRPPLPGPFISYSRRDRAFARKLYDALHARGRAAWVDLEGIEPSEEWLAKLHSAIDAAQAFVFVVTEHSLVSRHCADEIRYAAESNKKLIPIVLRDVPAGSIPEALARIQWIPFVDDDRFEENVDTLVRALDTDLERTARHTRLLVRAKEWDGGGRDRSFLLRGSDLDEAERWLLDSAAAKEPRPSPLQAEYIGASTRLERRTKNRVLSGVTGAAVVAVALSVVALMQRNLARENESQAVSRQLAAQAQGTLDNDLPLSMLLAVSGYQRRPTFEARQALLAAMHHRPYLERFLHGHGGRVDRLAFDASGTMLASAAADGSVIVWNLETGRATLSATASGATTPAIAISAAAGLLATAAASGAIRLSSLERGEVVDSAVGPQDVRLLAFSPDGRLLAAGTGAGLIAIHDLEAGEERCGSAPAGPAAGSAPITALRFDREGAALGSVDYAGTVRITDAATCAVIARSGNEVAGSVAALSADLSLAVITDAGFPEIGMIDVRGGSVSEQRIEGITDFLLSADFHPVNDEVALGTQAGEIVLWHPVLRRATRTLGRHASDVTAVAFDVAGRKLASASIQGEVILWDLSRTSPIEPVRTLAGPPAANIFFLDAQRLLVAGEDGEARILDARTGEVVAEPPIAASSSGLAVTRAGDRYAASSGEEIVVGELPAGAIVDRIALERSTVPPLFSPDGRYLAFADGRKTVLRVVVQRENIEVGERDEASTAMAFAPAADAFLYVASADAITVFDIAARRTREFRVGGDKGPVQSIALNDEGTILAAGGNIYDGTVRLWDFASGRLLRTLPSDDLLPIARVMFSPDGRTIAVVTEAADVLRLWDVATGQRVAGPIQLVRSSSRVASVAFAPDGGALATAEADGVVIRDLTPARWIDALCRAANRNLTADEWRSYMGAYAHEPTCAPAATNRQ